MSKSDFILVPSRNIYLVHYVLRKYLTDEWGNHNGIGIKTYKSCQLKFIGKEKCLLWNQTPIL